MAGDQSYLDYTNTGRDGEFIFKVNDKACIKKGQISTCVGHGHDFLFFKLFSHARKILLKTLECGEFPSACVVI